MCKTRSENNKDFLYITRTVEHNYISPSRTVGIQLHVSALYVGHLQVVINNKEYCVLHVQFERNYISPSSTVVIQLHVSALYVGHLQVVTNNKEYCVLHVQSNATIFHLAVQ